MGLAINTCLNREVRGGQGTVPSRHLETLWILCLVLRPTGQGVIALARPSGGVKQAKAKALNAYADRELGPSSSVSVSDLRG